MLRMDFTFLYIWYFYVLLLIFGSLYIALRFNLYLQKKNRFKVTVLERYKQDNPFKTWVSRIFGNFKEVHYDYNISFNKTRFRSVIFSIILVLTIVSTIILISLIAGISLILSIIIWDICYLVINRTYLERESIHTATNEVNSSINFVNDEIIEDLVRESSKHIIILLISVIFFRGKS